MWGDVPTTPRPTWASLLETWGRSEWTFKKERKTRLWRLEGKFTLEEWIVAVGMWRNLEIMELYLPNKRHIWEPFTWLQSLDQWNPWEISRRGNTEPNQRPDGGPNDGAVHVQLIWSLRLEKSLYFVEQMGYPHWYMDLTFLWKAYWTKLANFGAQKEISLLGSTLQDNSWLFWCGLYHLCVSDWPDRN